MPKRKKQEPAPIPARVDVLESNPFFSVTESVYEGEEARKARAAEERRLRRHGKVEEYLEKGLCARNRVILGACRLFPAGVGPRTLATDWEEEVRTAFDSWYTLPGNEAFWTGYQLGNMVGRTEAEWEAKGISAADVLPGRREPLGLLVEALAAKDLPMSTGEECLRFFIAFEDAITKAKRSEGLTQHEKQIVALVKSECEEIHKPIDYLSLEVDETGREPRIMYRLRRDSPKAKKRSCGLHNLETYILKKSKT